MKKVKILWDSSGEAYFFEERKGIRKLIFEVIQWINCRYLKVWATKEIRKMMK